MTLAIFNAFLIAALTMALPRLALAQQPTQHQPQSINPPKTFWGAISNGVCAGILIKQSDWGSSNKDDIYCNVELGNVTTNLFWVWLPPFEQRYEIELRGPDGQRVRQLKPFFHSQKTLWSGLSPLSTNSTSSSLDWFFLKDAFDIQTNGQFTLIASVRVNIFTNYGTGQAEMQRNKSYFLLPPVTVDLLVGNNAKQ